MLFRDASLPKFVTWYPIREAQETSHQKIFQEPRL